MQPIAQKDIYDKVKEALDKTAAWWTQGLPDRVQLTGTDLYKDFVKGSITTCPKEMGGNVATVYRWETKGARDGEKGHRGEEKKKSKKHTSVRASNRDFRNTEVTSNTFMIPSCR